MSYIRITIFHKLYDTMHHFPTDAAPIRSDTSYYNHNNSNNLNVPVSSITGYWQNLVSGFVDANLQSVQMLKKLLEEKLENGNVAYDEEWKKVNEINADGTPVTITDLAALTNPDWIGLNDPLDCTILLQFQYLIDPRLVPALPDPAYYPWLHLLK